MSLNTELYLNTNTSNLIQHKINKLIETSIENKINDILDILPIKEDYNVPKKIYEYTIAEIYNGTLQTSIDVINEMSELFSERKYMASKDYNKKVFDIFLKDNRKIFIGIILIMLSFILYFIDGSEV